MDKEFGGEIMQNEMENIELSGCVKVIKEGDLEVL